MSQNPRAFISRYGCAFVSIALAVWLRLRLDPVLGEHYPFATVWLALLVTAWYGGLRPALVAVVLGAFASDYFLLPPRGSFQLSGLNQQIGMGLYLFIGLGIALLGGSMHAAEGVLREAKDQLETRVRERTAELAEANERLRASEEHFRVIVEGVSSHAIFMLDPAGNVASWNRGSERIKGYQADEIVGRHFSQLYPPEDAASGKPQRGLQIAVAEGFFEEEGVRVRKDGSRFWAIVNITPLYDGSSQPIGFLKVTRDITERKKIEEALAAERNLLRTLIDALPHVVYTKDTAGRYVVCNPALLHLHGLTHEKELAGKTVFDLFPRDRAELYHADDLKALSGHPVLNHEELFVDAAGNRQRRLSIKVPLRDLEGTITGLVGISTDITARKEVEEALRAERDRFEKIVSAVPVVICSFLRRSDGTSCFPFANPAIEEIYGFRLEDLALDAAPIFTRMHPDDVDRVRVTLDESGRTMTPWKGEFRVRNPLRGEIWVEGHVIPSAEPNGAILWQGYIANITERKRADEALRDTEARFRGAFDHTNVAMVITDIENRFLQVNAAFARLFGYTKEEILRLSLTDLTHPDHLAESLVRREVLMAGEADHFEMEKRYLRKDRRVIWGLTNVSLVRDPQGRPVQYVGQVQDITERKLADEARILFRALLDHSNDAIEVIDLDTGGFLDANATAYQSLGYTREEFLALGVPDTNPSVAESGWAVIAEELRRTGSIIIETRHRRKDGSTFPVEVNARFIRLDREYSVATVRDITERKRADEALRESESRFRQIAENIREVFWLSDPVNNQILYVSPAYETVWGRESQTLYQSAGDWLEAIHTEDRDGVHQAYANQLNAGKFDVEYRIIRPDGTIRWIHDRGFPVLDAASNVYRIAGVAEDISERKRVAQSLRDSEERTRLLLDSAVQPIYGVDIRGNCTFSNAACARMLGYEEPTRLIGQNMHELIHHTRADGTPYPVEECRIYLAFVQDQGTHADDEVLWRADGTSFPAEYWSNPIRRSGQTVGAVVSFLDITERKSLEAQLQQAQKMEAFGQLAGGVAHDFNNLLTVISGYSDILLVTLPPDDSNWDMVTQIRHAGERAASLTRQLLAFSRQQVLEPRVLDLNTVITDTEKMLRRLIGEDMQFTTVLRPNISSVKVDPGQIEQVIMNLAVNARDAMPQGGKLSIETSEIELDESYSKTHAEVQPGRYVRLAISDTGCGMTPEVKARLFEPFFTTKGVGKGTGLGLAVVHGIVKQSGGSIDLYSEVGVGTTFKIYLPAVQERPANVLDTSLARSPRGRETVLLVEDEDAVREFAARALEGFGYTVLQAPGGKAALQLLESHREKIDLLVTDVVMPEMSGRQLAETILANHPGLKVLFLSGYTDDAVVRHGVLQADVAFLQKPFTPNWLARKVREVLDQK